MTYWLCITNEENWHVVKQQNVWGVAERHRNTIAEVKIGDQLVLYCKQEKIDDELKPSRIAGVFSAESAVFTDKKKIFSTPKGMGTETFPLRINLKPVTIFKEPVEFKPLIPALSFIKNKRKWAGHLMGKAMRPIPEEDFRLLAGKGS